MSHLPVMVANRTIKLIGNIFKVLSYPFHFILPKVRFTIPEYSPAKLKSSNDSGVTKVIWQTNYSNRSALPVYLNYLFNRLMSLSYDYRYVSTEAATLVWPLSKLLKGVKDALYIKIKNDTEITNYFLATAPNNPHFKKVMDAIVNNIENYDPKKGVYGTTGPKVFNDVLANEAIQQ